MKFIRTKLQAFAVCLLLVASLSIGTLATVHASALKSDACAGLSQLDSSQQCGDSSGINNLITQIVRLLSWIVGVASVIVIIIAGFKFVLAGGESAAVASAKNTLIYALVGLVIVALAQLIVHFAFTTATTCPYNAHLKNTDAACVAPRH